MRPSNITSCITLNDYFLFTNAFDNCDVGAADSFDLFNDRQHHKVLGNNQRTERIIVIVIRVWLTNNE